MFSIKGLFRGGRKAGRPSRGGDLTRLRSAFRPAIESLDNRILPHASPFGYNAGFGASFALGVHAAPDTAAATHLEVLIPPNTYATESTQATVVALDANNHPTSNYTGTVAFSSSDANATVPANYTFTPADRGAHTFSTTFAATGSDSLTATDTGNAAIAGTGTVSVGATQVATHLAVEVGPRVQAGSATQVLVVAEDASNRPVQNYAGTVQVTSSDANATLPANYTFTAADHGVHAFSLTLATSGSQTVTATDTGNATLSSTANVEVGTGSFHQGPSFGGDCTIGTGNATAPSTGNETTALASSASTGNGTNGFSGFLPPVRGFGGPSGQGGSGLPSGGPQGEAEEFAFHGVDLHQH